MGEVLFHKALKRLIEHEGGYANNSSDNGGETYKGISRKWFPRFNGWSLIDLEENKSELDENAQLQDLVADFYYTYFWYKLKCHLIDTPQIAEMVFITGVNVGKKVCAKKVQRILGVKQDGLIGNITISALNKKDPADFIRHFVLELVDFYLQVSVKNNNSIFLKGWISRAMSFYYDSINKL